MTIPSTVRNHVLDFHHSKQCLLKSDAHAIQIHSFFWYIYDLTLRFLCIFLFSSLTVVFGCPIFRMIDVSRIMFEISKLLFSELLLHLYVTRSYHKNWAQYFNDFTKQCTPSHFYRIRMSLKNLMRKILLVLLFFGFYKKTSNYEFDEMIIMSKW